MFCGFEREHRYSTSWITDLDGFLSFDDSYFCFLPRNGEWTFFSSDEGFQDLGIILEAAEDNLAFAIETNKQFDKGIFPHQYRPNLSKRLLDLAKTERNTRAHAFQHAPRFQHLLKVMKRKVPFGNEEIEAAKIAAKAKIESMKGDNSPSSLDWTNWLVEVKPGLVLKFVPRDSGTLVRLCRVGRYHNDLLPGQLRFNAKTGEPENMIWD
jgi:hypothetical protein